jgi:CRP-like cAMP-binding protein
MFELGEQADLLANLAALMLVLSALAGGGRLLHALGLGAGVVGAIHFTASDQQVAAIWAVIFALANTARLVRIVHQARRNFMTGEERALIEDVLMVTATPQQREVMKIISWRDTKPGEVLLWQGQQSPPLVYISSGQADIEHDGVHLGECRAGEFIGEMSLISGERASATVTVSEAARIAMFDRKELLQLSSGMPELSLSLDHAFNRGLTEKLQRMNQERSEA